MGKGVSRQPRARFVPRMIDTYGNSGFKFATFLGNRTAA
jgi:hypothetical protein